MSNQEEVESDGISSSFLISSRPVVSRGTEAEDSPRRENDNLGLLPRSYGQPILFAIARDPNSLFVYWDINWSDAFASAPPLDRKVYLRVYDTEGSEVKRITVEPLANSCDVPVAQPRSSFRIEIGYFDPEQMWRSVAASENVNTPSDQIGPLAPGDFVLVPFHITFQRLTELFRATASRNEPLTQSLARLQAKALNSEEGDSLTTEEAEIFRAMKASISGNTRFPKGEFDRASEMRLQKKLEKILGFGVSSPTSSFGDSSRCG